MGEGWDRQELGGFGAWPDALMYYITTFVLVGSGRSGLPQHRSIGGVRLPDPAAALDRGFLVPSALLVACSAALPWLAVGALWRRNRHEWVERPPFAAVRTTRLPNPRSVWLKVDDGRSPPSHPLTPGERAPVAASGRTGPCSMLSSPSRRGSPPPCCGSGWSSWWRYRAAWPPTPATRPGAGR